MKETLTSDQTNNLRESIKKSPSVLDNTISPSKLLNIIDNNNYLIAAEIISQLMNTSKSMSEYVKQLKKRKTEKNIYFIKYLDILQFYREHLLQHIL